MSEESGSAFLERLRELFCMNVSFRMVDVCGEVG